MRPHGPSPRPAAYYVQESHPSDTLAWQLTPPKDDGVRVLYKANCLQAVTLDNRAHHQQVVHLNGNPVKGLQDTGAILTLAHPHLVPDQSKTGRLVVV